ncbi:caspase family protein [Alphaproteobacteria bacterium]|nr:caspase family protein [Alphaproteobacteria bacterium]
MKYFLFIYLFFYSFQSFAKNNKFAGYCQRVDGSVYATFYKNNCHSNDKISFSEYAKIKKILIKDIKDEEIKIVQLKEFRDEGLITEEEYNYKRNEILGLTNNKKETIKKVIVSNDVIAPIITIADSFEADATLIAEINGSVFDDNEIVQITIDGDPVNFINNRFAQKLFVKPGGQKILITAMDKFGNESNKTILLKRSDIIIAKNFFDSLNPTIMKSKINPSAVALIIGIEDYQYTFAAPFAKNDALAFNDFAHYSLGVPMQNIKLLTNDNAERTSTLKSVKWLSKIVKEDTSDVYVFFSGHGLASEDGEDLYLLPSDGDPDLLEDSTLLRNELFDRIAKLNPRSVTVFLDTCYSGTTRSEEFLVAAKPIFIEAKEQDIPAKFTIFSASAGRETAKVLPEAQHGLFSYYMMKGLEGEADSNNDRAITNGELHAFINKNVSRQANQTPQLNGDPDQILAKW